MSLAINSNNPLLAWGVVQPPTVVLVLGIFFLIYERWIWKTPPFSWIHFPYLGGRYEGSVVSSYDNGEYPVVLEVRQSLLTTLVCLYTPRSASYSITADVGTNENENESLAYIYRNTPRTVTDNLDMTSHYGMAVLEYFGDTSSLKGFYFNDPRDRGRHGTLECKRVSRQRKKRFE